MKQIPRFYQRFPTRALLVLLAMLTVLLVACANAETGTLAFNANGEDFVRTGFVSKDGWDIAFDAATITLGAVSAYQTDPAYDSNSGIMPVGDKVALSGLATVDLAAGDADASPLRVGIVADAPIGHYNAISWQMVHAADGPAIGVTLYLNGTATKDSESVDFTIAVNDEFSYACGEFVGDVRKGILAADGSADLEMTFHFDHIFGDGSVALDDSLNSGALGFDPLAALAQNGQLNVNSADLQAGLSATDYQKFFSAVSSLGHVGEGHCYESVGG